MHEMGPTGQRKPPPLPLKEIQTQINTHHISKRILPAVSSSDSSLFNVMKIYCIVKSTLNCSTTSTSKPLLVVIPFRYFTLFPCVCFVCISHYVFICLCFHLGLWPSGF